MIIEKQTFKNKDLVLKGFPNIDHKNFDINKYKAFQRRNNG